MKKIKVRNKTYMVLKLNLLVTVIILLIFIIASILQAPVVVFVITTVLSSICLAISTITILKMKKNKTNL